MTRHDTGTIPGGMSERRVLTFKRPALSYSAFVEGLSPRVSKVVYSRGTQLLIDGAVVAMALTVSYLFRFDGELVAPYGRQLWYALPFAVSLCLAINLLSGGYKRTWRFCGLPDVAAIANVTAIVFAISIVWRVFDAGVLAGTPVPYGVLVMFPVFAFGGMSGVRIARRVLHNRGTGAAATRSRAAAPRKRLLLVGAGETGLHLLRELRDTDFEVVGFVDDDEALQGRTIGGWGILGTTHELESVVGRYGVAEVIICMPSASKAVLQRIVKQCAGLSIKTSSVPALWDIMSGRTAIDQLRPLQMEDLLGRISVSTPQDTAGLAHAYAGSRILVTGAGGSIGSELVRQLKLFQPSELILLDKDENNLYEITCEVREDFPKVTEVVADIRSRRVMEKLFALHRPEVVFHAAAYKHVPLMERYPAEAILNNVMGTRQVAELSDTFGVKMFVLVSTDKAVNPSSIMGASKRVAEMIVQDLASSSANTKFCCVRFGNVLGSRASVVPLFLRQIKQGKDITVTHPDVSRYFMTIPEAAQLVIQAGALGSKGEIFLLDMGDPVRIVDLARNLIELLGLVPDKDVSIKFTGLRPGEKLDEELLIDGELGVRSTQYSKIFVVGALRDERSDLQAAVSELEQAGYAGNTPEIYRLLRRLNIGYQKVSQTDDTPMPVSNSTWLDSNATSASRL